METHTENVLSTGLFIKEENVEAAHVNFLQTATQSDHDLMEIDEGQTLSIGPYLKEMDDLLKNCEQLTDTNKSTWNEEYMSTSCTYAEDLSREGNPQNSIDKCREEGCSSSTMPLTSAGNKLSESMAEYEGQLVNMLTALENTEEDMSVDYKPAPQDWSSNEEYVHIPKLFKEITMTPLKYSNSAMVETHTTTINYCNHRDSTSEVYSRKRAASVLTQNAHSGDTAISLKVQSPEKCIDVGRHVKVEGEFHPQSWTQIMCEETSSDKDCTQEAAGNGHFFNEEKVDMTGLSCGVSAIESLGPKLEECIDEVHCLEQKRNELQAEVMKLYIQQDQTTETNWKEGKNGDQASAIVAEMIVKAKEAEHLLREKSKSEIENLRQKRAEEERKLWQVNVERQGLHNDLWWLKRKLFVVAKACAQNQATLKAQQQHVEILTREKEKLSTAEVQMRDESIKLQEEHKQQLLNLQEQFNQVTTRHLSDPQEELKQCRRDLCGDVQQYLQDSLKKMEERYEPILTALVKRRDTAMDALTKVKEQTQELRVQLIPLREEIQKLTLQKVCSEEKLRIMSFRRREEMGQYQETVNFLDESYRELKMELRNHEAKNNNMKELKERLDKQLTAYRSAIEDQTNCNKST